jgi:DNA-directed RNA polymerase subunit RPC12/RpoP
MPNYIWRSQWKGHKPKCMFCDVPTEPTIIFQDDSMIVRGWRCPRCGFILINPNDIPKALDTIKNKSWIWER